jgi:uncharacterized RDD family membrane protein YckC
MTTVPVPATDRTVGRQGHYAGAVSRLVAFALDVGALWAAFAIGAAAIEAAVKLVTRHPYSLFNHQVLSWILLGVWAFFYFTYQWAVSGKTLGMAIMGLQVVTAEGEPIHRGQAALRTIGLGLTLLTLGIGFLGIVFQRERRALDDFVAGTAVVYDWDARAARLRWLARSKGAHRRGAAKRNAARGREPGATQALSSESAAISR